MTAADEVRRLVGELEDAVRTFRQEARQAVTPQLRHYTPWASQEEKLAYWPKRWVPWDAMCQATTEGDGSGEGHPSKPGIRACTRPAGHRDIRTGDEHEHLWGPERYSKERARSAARRIATENWALVSAVLAQASGEADRAA